MMQCYNPGVEITDMGFRESVISIHLFLSFLHMIILSQKKEYHGCNGLLAGVIDSGGIVPDHLSILDVHTLTNTVDLRTQYYGKHTYVSLLIIIY